jgi:hypothetical protein
MTPELSTITQLMRKSIDRMQKEGALRPNGNRIIRLQDVFPFKPEDVAGIRYDEHTGSSSIRFHLRNGKVFDGNGKPAEPPAPKN